MEVSFMDLSKTTQYALRALSFMAQDEKGLYIAKDLHEKLDIPLQYLRRLMKDLSKAGFLKSIKGHGGGFVFAKNTEEIYLSDILAIIEKKELLNACIFGFENCLLEKKCAMHDRWNESKESIKKILQTTNLSNMNTEFR